MGSFMSLANPMETEHWTLTQLHGEHDALVDVLCPDIVGGLVVEDGLDAAVHVALAGGHLVTGHGHDE